MADQNDGDGVVVVPVVPVIANAGGTFKAPQTWDKSRPSFKTDDHEDLLDFVEEVAEIARLSNITDEQEKKILFTKYLPFTKRNYWRSLAIYNAGTYDEFLKEIFKSYPEVQVETDGSMDSLTKICKKNREISINDEGKLRRFGIEFLTIAQKLMGGRSLLTNLEACKRYLDTLEETFSATLRLTVSSTALLKSSMAPALLPGQVAPAANRKGDPIDIIDLISMAETMASTQDETSPVSAGTEITRRSSFPLVKAEKSDARLDEMQEHMLYLKDAFIANQKHVNQQFSATADSLKSLAQAMVTSTREARDRPPHEDLPKGNQGTGSNSNERAVVRDGGNSRSPEGGCYYCDGTGHFSRDCMFKEDHISKGMLSIENGKTKLGDGNFIPRGAGAQRLRVEEYWRNKASGQNWFAQTPGVQQAFYQDDDEKPLEFAETARDEIRTLRVKLARAQQAGSSSLANSQNPVQPVFMASVQPGQGQNQQFDSNQALQAFLLKGIQSIAETTGLFDQLALTRANAKSGSSGSNL